MPIPTSQLDEVIASLNLTVTLDPDGRRVQTFETFEEAQKFFEREVEFWTPHTGGLSSILSNFDFVRQRLKEAASQNDVERARTEIHHARGRLREQRLGFISCETPLAQFLVGLNSKNPSLAAAALAYFDGTFGQRTLNSSREYLEGTIASIAFKYPEFFASGIDARLEAFDRQTAEVSQLRGQLASELQSLRHDMDEWRKATQSSIGSMLQEARESFSSTNAEWTNTFESLRTTSEKELAAIKTAYAEEMRLKEPATYWGELERTYKRQGLRWIRTAAVAIVVFCIAIGFIVYQPPALFHETKATLGGLKGALLIAAGISMFIYLINLFVKMATSSYHLARDARERLQLTHVFLALIKDSAMGQKDREIVLSALFSRADTGLLKGDSSPTMPTSVGSIAELLKGRP